MNKKIATNDITLETYAHDEATRLNNPPVGLVSSQTDKLDGTIKYEHDPHIDPQLSWAGKKEGLTFEVPNVSLHIHERIDPKRIVKSFMKKDVEAPKQYSLFEEPENKLPLIKAIEFYSHPQDWTNRLIAGDSLLVMNSLLQKEGMAGKVQMIYIDPPYGIKYNSNFQPFINKRDVKDNNDSDIPAEPEMIKAFRDTWELGIHSYLSHLQHRITLAKELLQESGSIFVQISDENVHHVKELLDEIFGNENFISLIAFKKINYQETDYLANVFDYLLWYGKNKTKLKMRKLYRFRSNDEINKGFDLFEMQDGSIKRNNEGNTGKAFRAADLTSKGESEKGSLPFIYNQKEFFPKIGNHWKTHQAGLKQLADSGRLIAFGKTLCFKKYADDFPLVSYFNVWDDTVQSTFATENIYVVQTYTKVIERCLLMTTDPGDLVLDPTCGSGTTAFVAEQWGRRWVTCDTSRVAIALAKQRLMTAKFDFYELAHPKEGLISGFKYKTVPHITLGSIANNEPPKTETLYDQPISDKSKIRVAGPFTIEAVPGLRVKPFDGKEPQIYGAGNQLVRTGETQNKQEWMDELKVTGIRSIGNKIIQFSRITPMVGTKYLHAEGEVLEENGENKKAVISFGSEYSPLEQRQVEEAIREAREIKDKPNFVIFAAFHFDPEAAKDIDQISWEGVIVLKAQMSVDLLTADLRKKRSSNQSYWLIGQPDIDVIKNRDGSYKVRVNGFDYYNPITGEIDSGTSKKIAMWLLDTDYDEQSLFPNQVFFPEGDSKRDWTKLAKALNGTVDEELINTFVGTESLSFNPGEHKKIAVKIIDDRGIESLVVKRL